MGCCPITNRNETNMKPLSNFRTKTAVTEENEWTGFLSDLCPGWQHHEAGDHSRTSEQLLWVAQGTHLFQAVDKDLLLLRTARRKTNNCQAIKIKIESPFSLQAPMRSTKPDTCPG